MINIISGSSYPTEQSTIAPTSIITTPPSNTTGVVGGEAEFFCELEFTDMGSYNVMWYHGSKEIYYYWHHVEGNYEADLVAFSTSIYKVAPLLTK